MTAKISRRSRRRARATTVGEHTMDMFQDAFEFYDFTGSKKMMVELVALFNPIAFGEFFADVKAKKMGNDVEIDATS